MSHLELLTPYFSSFQKNYNQRTIYHSYTIPNLNYYITLSDVLKRIGLIEKFKIDESQKSIFIQLHETENFTPIQIEIMSFPGERRYCNDKSLLKFKDRQNEIYLFETSKGIMTQHEAIANPTGGGEMLIKITKYQQ